MQICPRNRWRNADFLKLDSCSTARLSVELFKWFLSQSRHLSIARLIDQETFCLLDRCSIASRSIKIGFCSIVSRHLSIYWDFFLHALFFTCFASFFSLVIHSILFHYIHAFIWISFAPLIIFMFLRWSFLTSCTLCQSWQKEEEIVENMWFLFKTLRVRGRNTCPCKGEMCFILIGGVLTSFFLYIGLVTIWHIVYLYLVYIHTNVCYFTYLSICCFFSLFIHLFLIYCMQSIISVSH